MSEKIGKLRILSVINFINGSLWKGYEAAECDENSTENESSGKSVINICTWNISKGLVRKLSDSGFLNIVKEYDMLCYNECWVKCPDAFFHSLLYQNHLGT